MASSRKTDMLDRAGVAELLGVQPSTISVYRARNYKDSFPEPDGKIGGSAFWYRQTIETWAASRTGRTGRPRKS